MRSGRETVPVAPIVALVALAFCVVAPSSDARAGTSACAGADPAIVSARMAGATPDGELTRNAVAVTVTNLGNADQGKRVLQSVDTYQNGTKVGAKGIPPLAAGQSYTFTYSFERSAAAGTGTTKLRFQLTPQQATTGATDCNIANDRYVFSV